jgi:hypothetical protein
LGVIAQSPAEEVGKQRKCLGGLSPVGVERGDGRAKFTMPAGPACLLRGSPLLTDNLVHRS